MKNPLLNAQSKLVYGVEIVCVALFVLYLGFMTHYYILFYDGTTEMFEFFKKLQVLELYNTVLHLTVLPMKWSTGRY